MACSELIMKANIFPVIGLVQATPNFIEVMIKVCYISPP